MYWARYLHTGTPLVLLDWEVDPIVAESWRHIDGWLRDLGTMRRARSQLGAYIEGPSLAAQMENSGFVANPIPDHLTKAEAWSGMCQVTAALLAGGQVGYTKAASDKMDARPFLDSAGFRGGNRGDDPAVPAFIYGVVMGLDEFSARPAKPSKVKVVA